jgi:hypothetical protein
MIIYNNNDNDNNNNNNNNTDLINSVRPGVWGISQNEKIKIQPTKQPPPPLSSAIKYHQIPSTIAIPACLPD